MSVDLTYRDRVAIITLSRPDALNALNFGMIERIGETFDTVAASDARALIITGAGERAFCAGADITELTGRDLKAQKAGAELGQRVFAKLDTLPVPSIAAISGFALGGGCELALSCSFRLAAPRARFGLPEIKLGLIPGYGGTQRLPRLVGESRALEIILTGRMVGAEEALAIGLVNRIVEGDLLEAAMTFAGELAGYSLVAAGLAREAVRRSMDSPLPQGLQLEADLSTLAYQSADAEEGMAAFLEKRSAAFRDC
jgi:enoyl-CoA hydratase